MHLFKYLPFTRNMLLSSLEDWVWKIKLNLGSLQSYEEACWKEELLSSPRGKFMNEFPKMTPIQVLGFCRHSVGRREEGLRVFESYPMSILNHLWVSATVPCHPLCWYHSDFIFLFQM